MRMFSGCRDRQLTASTEADAAGAHALGIAGTPTFLIGKIDDNGRLNVVKAIVGAQAVTAFEATLDSLLGSGP